MNEIISNAEIRRRVDLAISELFERDDFLLRNDAHERSIAHKLAEYLQRQFPGRNVDCDYDLHYDMIKRLDRIKECAKERETDRIYPDILVHVRNTDDYNTLVIEMKTRSEATACDIRKLELMTSNEHSYNYQQGLFIRFKRLEKPDLEWFPKRS